MEYLRDRPGIKDGAILRDCLRAESRVGQRADVSEKVISSDTMGASMREAVPAVWGDAGEARAA
tara:strand:- start:208 stop:399 length:192 start_codon:yes stop_codon:yes gene_type:complete